MTRAFLLAVLLAGPARAAVDRPPLDDFYERGRTRSEDIDSNRGRFALLLGAQAANPSTEALRPTLAEGLRLGLDGGYRWEEQTVVRSRAWADFLRVQETGDTLTDLVLTTDAFYSTSSHAEEDGAFHAAVDAALARQTELQPKDFAELVRHPYRLADVEVEVAPVGPKIEKDAHPALPIGAGYRVRWDEGSGEVEEVRTTLTGAAAMRAWIPSAESHAQIDVLRLTRTDWAVPGAAGGDPHEWRLSAGYQRLSPGLPGVELWLLAGYAWMSAAEDASGWLGQFGAVAALGEQDHLEAGYDGWFTLDRQAARPTFKRLHRLRVAERHEGALFDLGLSYERISVAEAGVLHAVIPEIRVHPDWLYGLGVAVRYRLAAASGPEAPDEDRFNASLDWLL